jgi:hypothetical protein
MLRIDGRIAAAAKRVTPGPLTEYRKTASTLAVCVSEPFEVDTEEGVMRGAAGDYLCVGPAGEAWPVKAAIFEATYEPAVTV